MRKVIFVAIILAVAALVGCGGSIPPEQLAERKAKEQANVQAAHMPPGTKVIQNLGNSWYLIEVDVEGKKRKYLYRLHFPGTNYATETIVEVKD